MKHTLIITLENIQKALENIYQILKENSNASTSIDKVPSHSPEDEVPSHNTFNITEKQYKFLMYLLKSKRISPVEIMHRENVKDLTQIEKKRFSDLVNWLDDRDAS